MDITQQLKDTKTAIDNAVEVKRIVRNETDRKFIVANIGKDLIKILTPLMKQIAVNSRINKEEFNGILRNISVDIKPSTQATPTIEFPKQELIHAIKVAISKVRFPQSIIKVDAPKIPDEVKVEQMKELIEAVSKYANAKYGLDVDSIYTAVNNDKGKPLPVILTDEKGKFYTAIMQAISSGGGGGQVTVAPPGNGGSGQLVIATTGTAQPLSTTSVPCSRVVVSANTGHIVVGIGEDVLYASANRKGVWLAKTQRESIKVDNLQKVYVDVAINGVIASYFYEV